MRRPAAWGKVTSVMGLTAIALGLPAGAKIPPWIPRYR
jgi:hypothetical protein